MYTRIWNVCICVRVYVYARRSRALSRHCLNPSTLFPSLLPLNAESRWKSVAERMREIAVVEDRRPDDEPPANLIPAFAPGAYQVRTWVLGVMALETNSWDRLALRMPGRNSGTTSWSSSLSFCWHNIAKFLNMSLTVHGIVGITLATAVLFYFVFSDY